MPKTICSLPRRRKNIPSDQKDGEQGRYRLPVVILHQEEPQVQILPLYSKWRGKKEYDEMKEEVSSILGLSTTREEE